MINTLISVHNAAQNVAVNGKLSAGGFSLPCSKFAFIHDRVVLEIINVTGQLQVRSQRQLDLCLVLIQKASSVLLTGRESQQ